MINKNNNPFHKQISTVSGTLLMRNYDPIGIVLLIVFPAIKRGETKMKRGGATVERTPKIVIGYHHK